MTKMLGLFLLLMTTTTFADHHQMTNQYHLTPENGSIAFEIFKFAQGSKVTGKFKQFESDINYDSKSNMIKKIRASVQTNSVDTQKEKRDNHLRSPDFFDVQKHKEMTFKTSAPVKFVKGEAIKGKLTIKGITKNVELILVEANKHADHIQFKAAGEINRKDFGITWNKTMEKSNWKKFFGKLAKLVLDDKVDIIVDGRAK